MEKVHKYRYKNEPNKKSHYQIDSKNLRFVVSDKVVLATEARPLSVLFTSPPKTEIFLLHAKMLTSTIPSASLIFLAPFSDCADLRETSSSIVRDLFVKEGLHESISFIVLFVYYNILNNEQ